MQDLKKVYPNLGGNEESTSEANEIYNKLTKILNESACAPTASANTIDKKFGATGGGSSTASFGSVSNNKLRTNTEAGAGLKPEHRKISQSNDNFMGGLTGDLSLKRRTLEKIIQASSTTSVYAKEADALEKLVQSFSSHTKPQAPKMPSTSQTSVVTTASTSSGAAAALKSLSDIKSAPQQTLVMQHFSALLHIAPNYLLISQV